MIYTVTADIEVEAETPEEAEDTVMEALVDVHNMYGTIVETKELI